MLKKLLLLYHTTKYLKPIQILHQIKYRIWRPKVLDYYNKTYVTKDISFISFKSLPPVYQSYSGKNTFVFLNQERTFGDFIDWNFQGNGKLWNYNLQYANYLLQQDISFEEKKSLMESMFIWLNSGKLPLEPYPVSLRSINILRWLSNEGILIDSILENVHGELDFLSKRPEYHLLGNHLLENGFALIMGGAFFSEKHWLRQGQTILKEELDEQILSDGAHFELSPMYHQIILFRLLELIDWYSAWPPRDEDFEKYLIEKAALMLSWLKSISFKNGDIPHFNDSAEGIAYSTKWLVNYAETLAIPLKNIPLGISGYRTIKTKNYECKIDFAQLGPTYQPGHAHADALSFILQYKDQPLFVEKGTSTYQIGERRSLERATSAHNTVIANNQSQSVIWSGFRVAERATTQILKDLDLKIEAQHDGYRKLGLIHKRSFKFEDDEINIQDAVLGNNKVSKEFHLHLAPGLIPEIDGRYIYINDKATLDFDAFGEIWIEDYEMADGYNSYISAKKIVVSFVKTLNTKIQFK